MSEVTTHPVGNFCWAELATSDQSAAKSFYTELFGWKANEWNLSLLERHATPGGRPTSGDYLFVLLCSIILSNIIVFVFG